MKKIFISVDIEGIAGACRWLETNQGNGEYELLRRQMNAEALAVVEAVNAYYRNEVKIVLRDAHDSACNLDPAIFPENTTIIRGWSGGPLSMMEGVEGCEACLMVGYHSPASAAGSPLAHTMSLRRFYSMKLNGVLAAEYHLNYYAGLALGCPTIFLSGDAELCRRVNAHDPKIKTLATYEGLGAAVATKSPKAVAAEYARLVPEALAEFEVNKASYLDGLPADFELDLCFKTAEQSYRGAFYPGVERVNDSTLRFKSQNYMDLLTAFMFIE